MCSRPHKGPSSPRTYIQSLPSPLALSARERKAEPRGEGGQLRVRAPKGGASVRAHRKASGSGPRRGLPSLEGPVVVMSERRCGKTAIKLVSLSPTFSFSLPLLFLFLVLPYPARTVQILFSLLSLYPIWLHHAPSSLLFTTIWTPRSALEGSLLPHASSWNTPPRTLPLLFPSLAPRPTLPV